MEGREKTREGGKGRREGRRVEGGRRDIYKDQVLMVIIYLKLHL